MIFTQCFKYVLKMLFMYALIFLIIYIYNIILHITNIQNNKYLHVITKINYLII